MVSVRNAPHPGTATGEGEGAELLRVIDMRVLYADQRRQRELRFAQPGQAVWAEAVRVREMERLIMEEHAGA